MDFELNAAFPPMELPEIDFRSELNDEQFEAVTAEPGPLLILAGAGSGKTRTLTYRVAYLLSKGVSPGEILLLTFTNKAAKEMLSRVEELTAVEPRRFWGGTFHSIGHRLLRIHGEAIDLPKNFTILDAGEAETVLKHAVESVDSAFFKDKTHPKPGPLSSIISMARNTRESIERTVIDYFPQHHDFIDQIEGFALAYKKLKLTQNVVDYDDLLVFWLKLLDTAPEVAQYYQKRFRHTLVDEYQDTNVLQAEIVDKMATNHQIMAVGDDAQCIYSWRGANFQNIITFPDRHPNTRILRIETNYRSTPEILRMANAVIQNRTSQGFDKELRPFKPSSQKPYVIQAMDTREQAQFIITRIRGLIDEGRDPREIAILYRSHFVALDMQMELSRAGIPYQITSGVRFFEQAHIKDLVAHLRLVYNPADATAFFRITQLLPKVGEKTSQKLYNLVAEAAKSQQLDFIDMLARPEILKKVPAGARADWESLAITLRDMKQIADGGSPDEVVQMGIDGWYSSYLQGAYSNYLNRLEDLNSLVGFAARFEEMQDLIAQITLLNSETSGRLDESDECIRLTTVHQAKGLEYDVVFLIGIADGFFPTRRSIDTGDTEEERRLFYVAVTRARDELYITYPKMNTKGGPSMFLNPSRFLQELSTDLFEPIRIRRNYGW
ncbi:ATP-dependent helicase [Pelagicoccus sp. SDUM812003]|uniref:ATP-dependent helicase n=1 Tax=Pelagicoccus sp. SDUM812003 TaxID=3041267 RepID=UPI00280FC843|nr:ATP-dependent helicase [Pelagicoccus sp. SDUM812003]MDQ8205695.1 ATP-dependent helicase [Pelagicoccus sp. SDUM812003]